MFLLCFLLAGCVPHGGERQFVQSQAYHVGDEPLALKDLGWKAYAGDVSAGYGAEPLWIRLNVTPVPDLAADADIEITVSPNYLDQIDLYDLAFKKDRHQSVGERFPLSNNAQPALMYTFSVPNGAVPRIILLRVKTASARLVKLTALPLKEARQYNTEIISAHTIILVLFLVALCLACYMWMLKADSISTAFLMLQTVAFLYGAVMLGFSRLLFSHMISPEMQDMASRGLIVGYSFANFCFYYVLLLSLGLKKWVARTLQFLLSCIVVVLALYLFGQEWQAFQANSVLLNLWAFLFVPISIWGVRWRRFSDRPTIIGKKFLIGYAIAVFVANSLFTLSLVNVKTIPFFNVYGGLVNGILTSFIMVYFFHKRAQNFKAESTLALKQMRMAYENQKDISESRELFLGLLNHELKTPLSTILLASAERIPTKRMKLLSEQAARSMVEILKLSSESLPYIDHVVEPNFKTIDAKLLLEQVVGAQLNTQRFVLDLNSGCDVVADTTLLTIILNNLLENAIKYSPGGTFVVVSLARRDPSTVQISVSNEVSEAASKNVHRFFEKYFRSTESGRQEGLGLGLYLAKTLAELQRGALECEVVANRMCFTLNLFSAEAYDKHA